MAQVPERESDPPDLLVDIPFLVLAQEHGTRLDVFLSRRIQRMSRSLAARIVADGQVRLEGSPRPPRASDRVRVGGYVILRRRKLDEPPSDDLEIPIVFDDPWILGVSKPGNLVVHPTASAYHRTLIRVLRRRFASESLDLAHRIDKETSGLVVLARTSEAAAALKGQFADRRVTKSYLALVRGVPAQDRFVVEAPLRLMPGSLSAVRMEVSPDGAEARTECTVLARGPAAALVEARPVTGRQHQIRVHLHHVGHPIIGDKLYLGNDELFIAALRDELTEDALVASVGHVRQALHAYTATFAHPATHERITLTAPPARDLAVLARSLGLRLPGDSLEPGAHTTERECADDVER